MELTTHLELHSQATRLDDTIFPDNSARPKTGFSPSLMLRSNRLRPADVEWWANRLQFRRFRLELSPLQSPLL